MRFVLLPHLLILFLAFGFARCAPPNEIVDERRMVEPSELFQIPLGADVDIMEPDGTVGATLTFEEVIEDSRCPRGVQCVREGEARVRMTLRDADARDFRFETSVPGLRAHGVAPDEADQQVASAYVFHFLRLDPYPTADEPAGAPVAIFQVRYLTR